jgi:hypothetical protein
MTQQQPTAGRLLVAPDAPGIRGWLAFFSIGVWVEPLVLSYYAIQGWVEVSRSFEKSAGRPLDVSTVYRLLQRAPDDWNAAIFFAFGGMSVALVSVSIMLITQWWRRKRQFPRNWILFQAVSFALAVIILIVTDDSQVVQPRDVIGAAAHILFWWKSRRVAATFTQ